MSYAWYEDETLLGTNPVLTTSLPSSSDHTVVLTVTDDDGITRGDPVTVQVGIVPAQLVYSDDFSSLGSWVTGGDVQLSTADSFPTPPQVRVGGSGAFLRRSAAMPAGSTGMTLDFWAKTTQFAPSDELRVNVSVDGGPFTTIKTFTSADPQGSYVFYGGSAIPLGHTWFPAVASNLTLEFESSMGTGSFFVDDVKLTALMAPRDPIANAGPDQTASDTDGDGLEPFTLDGSSSSAEGSIVSYEWREGGTLLGTGVTLGIFVNPAVHLVTLTVTDDAGASDDDTVLLTLASNQPPVANAGPDLVITDSDGNGSESVTIDGGMSFDPDGSINSFEWRDGAALLGTSTSLIVSFAVGTHVLDLMVVDDAGATTVDSVEVSVQAPSGTPDPGEASGVWINGFDPMTGKISFTFTPACQAADHNIVYGPLSGVASYGYSGQICGIGTGGAYDQLVPGPGSFFFLVVGTDGVSKEGSYGQSSAAGERPEQTGDPVCVFTQQIGPPCP